MMKNNMNTRAILKISAITSPIAILCRSMSYRIAALLTVVVFSLLVNLGLWQFHRGEEKQNLEHQLNVRSTQKHQPLYQVLDISEPLTGLKVSTAFTLTTSPLIYLDNQIHQGQVGYLIYQIVKPELQTQYLLIELGFMKAGYDRSALPMVTQQIESHTITGRLYTRSSNPLSSDLIPESLNQLRIQNLNFKQLEAHLGFTLLPFALQPDSLKDWPLSQPWTPLSMKSSKHFGYSIQWFVMAGVWLSLMCVLFLRKIRAINKELT